MFFKKKREDTFRDKVKLMEFNMTNLSSGNVLNYVTYLRDYHQLSVEWDYYNYKGQLRGVILSFGLYPDINTVNYFKDRCPAIVELECRLCKSISSEDFINLISFKEETK